MAYTFKELCKEESNSIMSDALIKEVKYDMEIELSCLATSSASEMFHFLVNGDKEKDTTIYSKNSLQGVVTIEYINKKLTLKIPLASLLSKEHERLELLFAVYGKEAAEKIGVLEFEQELTKNFICNTKVSPSVQLDDDGKLTGILFTEV